MANNSKYRLMLEAILDSSSIQTQIDALQSKYQFNINVNVNAQGASQAQAAVSGLQDKVKATQASASNIKVNVSTGNSVDVLQLLEQKIKEVTNSVNTSGLATYRIHTGIDKNTGEEIVQATVRYTDELNNAITKEYQLVKLSKEEAEQTGIESEFRQIGNTYLDDEIARQKQITAELERQRVAQEKARLAKEAELKSAQDYANKYSAKLSMYSGDQQVQGTGLVSQLNTSIASEDVSQVRILIDQLNVLSVTLANSSREFEQQQDIMKKGQIVIDEFANNYQNLSQWGVKAGVALSGSIKQAITAKDADAVAEYSSQLKVLEKEIDSTAAEFDRAAMTATKFLEGQSVGKYSGTKANEATQIANDLLGAVKSQDIDTVRQLSDQLNILGSSLSTSSAEFKKQENELQKYIEQANEFIRKYQQMSQSSSLPNAGNGTANSMLESSISVGDTDKKIQALKLLSETLSAQDKEIQANINLFEKADLQADKFLQKSKTMGGKDVQEAITVANQLKKAIQDQDPTKVEQLSRELEVLNAGFATSGFSIRNWVKGLGDAMRITVEFGITSRIINTALESFNNGIQYIKDLDKEMTTMREVTNMTADNANKVATSYNDLAKSLGATTLEVAKGANEWLKQGKSISESMDLVKSSTMLSKITGVDAAESTQYLTSVLNGYKLEAKDAISVIDKLVAVDNTSATSTAEMADALQRTSTMAQMAGVDLDHLIAYIATVESVTRKSSESVGTSFQSMFSRMENIKLGKLDQTGVSINDVEKALSRVDIKLRENETTFRNMQDVLDDVSKKWDTLNDLDRSSIAQAIAGTEQRENFIALMSNYNMVIGNGADKIGFLNVQTKAAGMTEERFAIYLESVEAKANKFQTAWEKLVTSIGNSDAIKQAYDIGTQLLTLLTDLIGKGVDPLSQSLITIGTIIVLSLIPAVNTFVSDSLAGMLVSIGNLVIALSGGTTAMATFATATLATAAAFLPTAAILLWTYAIGQIISLQEQTKKQTAETTNAFATNFTQMLQNGKSAKELADSYGNIVKSIKAVKEQSGWAGWFVNDTEIIRNGFIEVEKSIRASSKNWDEYKQAVQIAANNAGYYIDEFGNLTMAVNGNIVEKGIASWEKFNASSKESYDANEAISRKWKNSIISDVKEVKATLATTMELLNKEIKGITSIEQNAVSGKLSFDDINTLLTQYSELIQYLEVEGNVVTLNTDKVREFNVAKIDQSIAARKAAGALQPELDLLQNYRDQVSRAIPLTKEYAKVFEQELAGITEMSPGFKKTADEFQNLNYMNEKGILSSEEYFDQLKTAIDSVDMKKTFGNDSKAGMAFFGSLTQNAANSLQQINSMFEAGEINIVNYIDQLAKLTDVFGSLGEMVANYTNSLQNTGDSEKELANQTLNDDAQMLAESKKLKDLQELNAQLDATRGMLISGSLKEGTKDYENYMQAVANAAIKSGQVFTDAQGNILKTSEDIYTYLMQSSGNFEVLAQQGAQSTGKVVASVLTTIGKLMDDFANTIEKFQFTIPIKAIQTGTSPFRASIMGQNIDMLIPSVDLNIGDKATSSAVAGVIHSAAQNLINNASNIGNQFDANLYGKPNFNQLTGSAGKASNELGGLNTSLQAVNDSLKNNASGAKDAATEMGNLLKIVEDMIKQQKEAEKTALKDELDNYKKLIDAQKQKLDLLKQELDYQDELGSKNKDLSKVQNDLINLSMDDSEEAKAKRLQLQDEETKKKAEITKFQRDKQIENDKAALDKDYTSFETTTNNKIKVIDNYLKQTGQIANDAMALINNKSSSFYQTLLDWNRKYGDGIDATVTKAWDSAYAVLEKYRDLLGNINYQYAMEQLNKITANAGAAASQIGNAVSTIGASVAAAAKELQKLQEVAAKAIYNSPDILKQEKNYNVDLNGDGKIGFYHTGGIVGGNSLLKSNEEFAKLLKGEGVFTSNQMDTFVTKTLPSMMNQVSTNVAQGLNIDKVMDITVQGNLDKSVLPDLENLANKVFDKLNNALGMRGMVRSAKSFGAV